MAISEITERRTLRCPFAWPHSTCGNYREDLYFAAGGLTVDVFGNRSLDPALHAASQDRPPLLEWSQRAPRSLRPGKSRRTIIQTVAAARSIRAG